MAAGYTPHKPSPANGRHTLICLQTLSTFANKIFSKCTKHSHPLFIMNTLAPLYPPPRYPSTSATQDTRFSAPAVPTPTTFSVYIQHLDQWEYRLLRDSLITSNVFSLSETIQNNPQIIAASDGSVTSSVGTYGWICSLPHGQHLATNHGQVFGSSPSSFCAKAYGLLSYLRFLFCVSQYTHSRLPTETIIYTNSASLIKKNSEIEK